MAKSSNGSSTNGEPKARRAPERRRSTKPTAKAASQAPDMARSQEPSGQPIESPARSLEGVGHTPAPEEVRRRAYDIYVRRGQGDGRDLDDWYEAERQLMERRHH
ncbi:MAG TPA: DUF2934 domain-containing protein [Vicinamibacterales bacterium]|jgi:hypothetical protein